MKQSIIYKTLLLVACTSLLTYTTTAFAESTNETEQSTLSESSSDTSDTEQTIDPPIENDAIISFVESAVDANTKEAIPLETPPKSSQIREELMKEDYHLSKETLDNYTDTQLENAMTLFTRYNYDVTGMDYGAYARLLTTLYVDTTVNVEDALTALYYNPNDIKSYDDLLKDVPTLNGYLSTLYPSNSTFLAIRKMTDDELTQVLTRLSITEKEQIAQGNTQDYGKIAPLLYVTDEDFSHVENNTTVASDTETSTTSSTSAAQETTTQTLTKEKEGTLPKTGEKGHPFLYLGIGIAIIGTVVYTYLKKNKRV